MKVKGEGEGECDGEGEASPISLGCAHTPLAGVANRPLNGTVGLLQLVAQWQA